jgi:ubiquinone/menaquinone biosynthesis C-methylase UbiE
MTNTRHEEERQSVHYDEIASEYDRHYSDPTSEAYRARFVNGPLTQGIDLEGRNVLEAMCGSGSTIGYLLSKGAKVTGLDISENLVTTFKQKWPQCDAIQASILDSGLPDASFDCVVVVGGLHHVQPHVNGAVDEIYRILKPGGWFCFAEPHAQSLPDLIRGWWYRVDNLFERNEAALDLDSMKAANRERFDFVMTKYSGSIAYLLVYNSMVFRIPVSWKRYYAPPLLALESALAPLVGKRLGTFVVCQWRKR